MSNFTIIVAGGRGKRMQAEKNKCFLPLAGKEVVAWTIDAFKKSGIIDGIVVVVSDSDEVNDLKDILNKNSMSGSVRVIIPTGGKHRQDGVWTGLQVLEKFSPKPDDVVLIHNGANPLVDASEIKESIAVAKEHGASVCAMRVKDTIKRVDDNQFAIETLNRKELWAMQTPQTIKYSIAIQAFKKAFDDNFYGTDDVQLVERIGGPVKIVECSRKNFKLTTPEDMQLAEKILKKL